MFVLRVSIDVLPLVDIVQDYLDRQLNVFGELKPIADSIVCCSAGADSTYLAYAISAILPDCHHHLVYFNHAQRPEAIPNEVAHVQALGAELGMQVHIIALDIQKVTQEAFRLARLDALTELSKKISVSTVFFGHHLDDDMETLWMQLGKGATVGLRGIPFCTKYNDMHLLHPFLCLTKSQIIDALQTIGGTYCIDLSNSQDIYTRNRVRGLLQDLITEVPNAALENGMYSLQYLKSMHQLLRDKVESLSKHMIHIDNCVLVRKSFLLDVFDVPEYGVSVWMADVFNQYMNREQCAVLAHNLKMHRPTQLVLQEVIIYMDYDWLCVQPKDWVTSLMPVKIESTGVHSTVFGTLCVTQGDVLDSSNNMLCVLDLRGVCLGSIEQSGFRIPDHKKRCRLAGISPILQRWWPIIYTETDLLFVPNGYVAPKMTGNICITIQSFFTN
jgi:tRNA(Ile)-lysidine synthetase-like protein